MGQSPIIEPLSPALLSLIRSGECVAFIGSGLSSGIYPTWSKLIDRLCEACGLADRVTSNSNSDHYLDLADKACGADSNTYHRTLGELFARTTRTNPLYSMLLRLPFKSYITLNFDPLLALEHRLVDYKCGPLKRFPDLNREFIGSRALYHVHGLVEDGDTPAPGTLILSRTDFENAYAPSQPLFSFLRDTFKWDKLCFIGCKLEEPPMKNVFDVCKKQQEELRRLGGGPLPDRYIILPSRNAEVARDGNIDKALSGQASRSEEEGEAQRYEQLGIQVERYKAINADHIGLLRKFELATDVPPISKQFGFGSLP